MSRARRGRDVAEPQAGPVSGETRPLSRNRGYNILWSSQLLSEIANEMAFVAFPLLILATSGSLAQLGVVSAVLAAASVAASLPAGLLADRVDRRTLMLVCQGGRSLALGSLAVVALTGTPSFGHILVVAAVEGALGAVFQPAEYSALPQVVPRSQLSLAIARNTARPFAAILVGPSVVGITFAFSMALPLLIQAATLLFSFFALLLLRPLPQVSSARRPWRHAVGEIGAGFRWALGHRVIRPTLVYIFFVNIVFHAVIILVIAISGEDTLATGEIGLTMACFGIGGLLGGVVAARVHSALPASVIVIGFAWVTAVVIALMALVPEGLALGVLLGTAALLAPVANTTVATYQLLVTRDELRGRLSGITGLASGAAGSLGPLLSTGALALFGVGGSLLALAIAMAAVGTGALVNRTLRHFPTLRSSSEITEAVAERDHRSSL
ncbi:MFS transporter [Actinoalloteichus sp. AHMU CJ021]|uniref:MFS transporter n=1 Tax=Actinoalloteichus TaxID=65496 RepID=UPI00068932CB|nr:MFS transporter [Actinoalloteichus caeruleus]AUS77191.1 MFS transporter [Actinoalloteichus sp. AHMU CJ021]